MSRHPLIDQLLVVHSKAKETFDALGEDFVKLEAQVSHNGKAQLSLYVHGLDGSVHGTDPDDVVEEAKRRFLFARRQNALQIEAKPVEPKKPDDDIPF
jgi:hypothetical protein